MAEKDVYTQIILEDLIHKLKIIAEGQQLLAEKLELIKQRIDAIELRLDYAGIAKRVS
jgi:hypothetical protein